MPWSCSALLSVSVLFLITFTFLLQLVSLTTTWWATYVARPDLGKPKENGHYGLWTLCAIKGPHWVEDCDPLDTFFKAPPYARVSGILGIVHLVQLLALLPLGALRAAQIVRNVPDLGIRPKLLCIAKVSVAFVTVIFSILVAIFVSVGENRPVEYTVSKGWSFWIQISVIVANLSITLVCVAENFRFWKEHIQHHTDPLGHRAETYGNPTFDSGSPVTTRRAFHGSTNGSVSYTEASGDPYSRNPPQDKNNRSEQPFFENRSRTHLVKKCRPGDHRTELGPDLRTDQRGTASLVSAETFSNPTFQEHSPNSRHSRRQRYD